MDDQENHDNHRLESPLEEEFDQKWKEAAGVMVPPLPMGSLPDGTSFEIAVAPVPSPTHIALTVRDVAQPGRALGLGPRRRRFKSCRPDHFFSGSSSLVLHLKFPFGFQGQFRFGFSISSPMGVTFPTDVDSGAPWKFQIAKWSSK